MERLLEGVSVQTFVDTIIEPVRTIADRGGKSWRSYAALACCDMVGGDSREYVQWLALPELIHVGSLIVDDVQDKSTVRRGGPPVHDLYGEAIAINAGTAAYFLGQKLLRGGKNLSNATRLELYDEYFLALRAGHVGQGHDIAGFEDEVERAVATGNSEVLELRILAANRLKTAVPAASLARMGAIAGGGTAEQIDAIGQFFESLGLAFQVIDDLLNLRGFRGDLKERGEDLVAGKVTLPVAKCFSRLPLEQRQEIWRAVRAGNADRDTVERIIHQLEECGALTAAEEQAHHMVEAAWRRLDPLVPDSMPKVMLRAFGWYVLDRHY
jgi:geranylgeranyl pyrophosphate synthase